MRALITGAEGFAGGHLVRHLQAAQPELSLYGTARPGVQVPAGLEDQLAGIYPLDLKDGPAVQAMLAEVRPDAIYHLAAQAAVPRSFEDPWETLENNIRSQLNLILGLLALDLRPRVLVISSAEVYGAVPAEQMPITEDMPLAPSNPYSVSKVAQDMLGLQYFLSHGLPVLRVRPFNHIGPGQATGFAAAAFAVQIARIEQGLQPPVIEVGNLSAERDFCDVRDVVAAYRLVVTHGEPGEVYNICSGQAVSIQQLLDVLVSYSRASVQVRVDPQRLRVVDRPLVVGSAARLQAATGWAPSVPLEESLLAVLEDARARVAAEREQAQSGGPA